MRCYTFIVLLVVLFLGSACAPHYHRYHHPRTHYGFFQNQRCAHNYHWNNRCNRGFNNHRMNSLHAANHTGALIGTMLGGAFVHPHSYRWMMFSGYNTLMNSAMDSMIGY
jgi:hypothetical protein